MQIASFDISIIIPQRLTQATQKINKIYPCQPLCFRSQNKPSQSYNKKQLRKFNTAFSTCEHNNIWVRLHLGLWLEATWTKILIYSGNKIVNVGYCKHYHHKPNFNRKPIKQIQLQSWKYVNSLLLIWSKMKKILPQNQQQLT